VKSTYRIGGALALGIVIIFGAFYMKDTISADQAGTVVVSQAPLRTIIPVTDANSDGTPDWQNELGVRAFKTIEVPTSSTTKSTEPYTPPTTLTGKFSEAFMQDYLEGKISGKDFSDPTAFIGTALQAIDANTQSKKHSQIELTIIPDSPEAIRNYGNQVADMLKSHAKQNENEAIILQRALAANDPELLKPLVPIREVYEATIPDMLAIPVPTSLVSAHLNLLNAFEAILTDVSAMQLAFSDPLFALARAKGYSEDSAQLLNGFKEVGTVLTSKGVTYANDESGAFFMIFSTL